jgi:1,4-alpha-glucan branching enzyme
VSAAGSPRGALAIVLHTHMPYVEGFGTWPFGEEWLWEAIACCYLPLLALLDAGAPLTLSLTPVLCDQLEADGVSERFGRFIGEVRRTTHTEDAAGLRAAGHEELAAEVDRSWSDYERAHARMDELGGELLQALRPHAHWTSSATHAVLPLLATDAGVRAQVQTGIDSHRRRFGEGWRGGFWLPECALQPPLLATLEDCGVRSTCVELTELFGVGDVRHLRPLETEAGVTLVPIDRATISLVWSDEGYPAAAPYRDYHHHTVHHHNPWNNAGDPYDHGLALQLARRHAIEFVTSVRRRLAEAEASAPGLADGALVVCALDTELLGHWWYEGPEWLEQVVSECERQGVELLRLDDALERFEALPAPALDDDAASSWGRGGDLSTWSGPAVADMAFAARAAELRLIAHGAAASPLALRELLALQASDWPFMVSREIAVPYARERFAGHERTLALALAAAGPADAAAPGAAAATRNLAVDARPSSLAMP